MSKPTLSDLPRRYHDQAIAQLHAAPKPRTIHREQVEPIKPAKKKRKPSYDAAEATRYFDAHVDANTFAEFQFHPERKWRFDFAWPYCKVALEVQGGIWINGGHSRGSGIKRDMEKENAAVCLGWRVAKCVPADLYKAETLAMIREALAV